MANLKIRDLLPLIHIGGIQDLITGSTLLGGLMLSNPTIITKLFELSKHAGIGAAGPALASLAGAGLASVGAWRGGKVIRDIRLSLNGVISTTSGVRINSDPILPSPVKWNDWDGMNVGYDIKTGSPIIIDWESWMRHCFIIGQSGVGKTVLGEWLMLQQIARGGSLLFIDGKLDSDNLSKLHAMASWAGRANDLLVINPGKPLMSNSYNPILYGDPDEVAARILSLVPASEGSPGTDHYRQGANQAIGTLINALKSTNANTHKQNETGMAYNFMDLSIILQSQQAMMHFERIIDVHSDGGRQFRLWLDQFKITSKEGMAGLDLKKMRELFGGIGGRMYSFGSGNFGQITSTYDPEVNLFEALTSNKIVYVALPTMGKAEAAQNFGKMVVGDYRTAVSWIQDLPKDKRPWPPTLAFFDEAGSYVNQSWARIFEQGRSAHQALVPAVQTMANLDAVSEELRSMVVGNTNTKIFFKLGEAETIKAAVDMIGEEKVTQYSVGFTNAEVESSANEKIANENVSVNTGKSINKQMTDAPRVRPTTIQKLGKGEAIVLYENSRIYHVKIPQVSFTKDFTDGIGKFEVNKKHPSRTNGLGIYKTPERWISDNQEN